MAGKGGAIGICSVFFRGNLLVHRYDITSWRAIYKTVLVAFSLEFIFEFSQISRTIGCGHL